MTADERRKTIIKMAIELHCAGLNNQSDISNVIFYYLPDSDREFVDSLVRDSIETYESFMTAFDCAGGIIECDKKLETMSLLELFSSIVPNGIRFVFKSQDSKTAHNISCNCEVCKDFNYD